MSLFRADLGANTLGLEATKCQMKVVKCRHNGDLYTMKLSVLLSIAFALPFLTATGKQADATVEPPNTHRRSHS